MQRIKDNALTIGIALLAVAIIAGWLFKIYYSVTHLPWWMWGA